MPPEVPEVPEVHDTRVRVLNDSPAAAGKYVLYWMQQSQRARFNHALEYAAGRATNWGSR